MFELLKRCKRQEVIILAVSTAFVFLQVHLELQIPKYLTAINGFIQVGGVARSAVFTNLFIILFFAFISVIISLYLNYAYTTVFTSVAYRYRRDTFNQIMNLKKDTHTFTISSLLMRTTNDINKIQDFGVVFFLAVIKSSILMAGITIILFTKSVILALITLALTAVIFVVGLIIVLCSKRHFLNSQKAMDQVNHQTRNNLAAYKKKVKPKFNDFDIANNHLKMHKTKAQNLVIIFLPVIIFIINTLVVFFNLTAINKISESNMWEKHYSLLLESVSYVSYLFASLLVFISVFALMAGAIVSKKRVQEIYLANNKKVDITKKGASNEK